VDGRRNRHSHHNRNKLVISYNFHSIRRMLRMDTSDEWWSSLREHHGIVHIELHASRVDTDTDTSSTGPWLSESTCRRAGSSSASSHLATTSPASTILAPRLQHTISQSINQSITTQQSNSRTVSTRWPKVSKSTFNCAERHRDTLRSYETLKNDTCIEFINTQTLLYANITSSHNLYQSWTRRTGKKLWLTVTVDA